MNARRTIRLAACHVDLPDLGGQQDTALAAGAGWTAARGVVPAWRDLKHSAHRAHAVAALVGLDERVLHVNSRAK